MTEHARSWVGGFVCPICKGPMDLESVTAGSSLHEDQVARCQECSATFHGRDGAFDFVKPVKAKGQERRHYDSEYGVGAAAPLPKRLARPELHRRWHDPFWPESQPLLRHLGNLADKVVLCLGNGMSSKELYFLFLGARVIHSDLSLAGVLQAKRQYDLGKYADRAAFHAIDAYAIPFPDDSVDVVYGYEFIHHLPDLHPFLEETRRVLKPGGMCLFFDSSYSSLWHGAKMTVLWPLMRLSHWLHKRSQEDLAATRVGGYRADDMERLFREHGFGEAFFERMGLFQPLLRRGMGAMIGWNAPPRYYRAAGRIGSMLDALLTERVELLARNRVRAVFGCSKPTAPRKAPSPPAAEVGALSCSCSA